MKGQNVFVPEEDGVIVYDQSLRSKLYAMGYVYNPQRAKVKLAGFTGWKNPNLCYNATTQAIKRRHKLDDVIVMLGSKQKQMPYHVILLDRNGDVAFDNNAGTDLDGKYIPGDGYFATTGGRRLYDFVHAVTVKEFLHNTQDTGSKGSMKTLKVTGNQVTAAVSEEVLQDTICALYFIMYYSMEDKPKITPAMKKKAAVWMAGFTKFLNQFRIPKDDFITVMDAAKNNRKFTNAVNNALSAMGNMLAKSKEKFEKDNTIPKSELDLLVLFGQYYRTNNENKGLKLLSKASIARDPDLLALLAVSGDAEVVPTTGGNQSALMKKMKALTKKFLKKELIQLSKEDRAKFKKVAPDAYKQFTKTQNLFLDVPDNFLRKLVRASGQSTVNYQDFLSKMKSAKISHVFPEGFVGRIDENAEYYTEQGLQLHASPKRPIKMNPSYSPNDDKGYVCTYQEPNAKSATKIYTMQHVTGTRADKKFSKTPAVADKSDELRNAWLKHLKGTNDRGQIHAARIELMWRFGARPGTLGNKAVNPETGKTENTYGILTLLVKHIKRVGQGFELDYPGKGHTGMSWVVKGLTPIDKALVSAVLSRTEGKGANDLLWIDEKGKFVPTQATLIYGDKLGKAHGLPGVTNYTWRYLAADGAARKALGKIKLKRGCTQAEAEAAFDKAMEEVGSVLKHHTGANVTGVTARDNYVDPELSYKFFFSLGLRPQKKLPKIAPAKYKQWLKESQKSK